MSIVGTRNRYARIRRDRETIRDLQILELLYSGYVRVPEFENYFISRDGALYSSLWRRVMRVSPGTKLGGYEFVGLRNSSGVKYRMIHRLVALAFIPNPLGLPAINHKDCNKKNNSVENLEWCTYLENARHAVANGRIPSGTRSRLSKLTEERVREIRAASGTSTSLMARFGVSLQTICNVRNLKVYRNVA